MIQIDSFARKKKTSTSSSTGSSGTGFANTSPSSSSQWTGELETHYFWGQPYNGTQDVEGDLTGVGGVTASGNISTSGEIFATGNITSNDSISCEGLTVTDSATIKDIVSDTIDSGYIHSDTGSIDEFGSASANITELESDEIVTERLTVTKQAHFFNLTIDEIKSVGGQVILSAGNATIDVVNDMGATYSLAWKKTDDENGVENQFQVNDQVICQTFNKTDATGQNVTNKYYWALITAVGTGTYTIDGEETACHFISISKTYFDGSSVPEAGDKICQLGYRGNDDPARQSAIILSAYQSPDPNVTAPSIVQYAGISSFSLNGCIVNQMSPSSNLFTGEFKVVNSGTTTDIVDLIQGQYPQVIVDSEQAWMMADSNGKTYVGTDYQNLPTTVQAFLGSQLIPYSEWITGSQIKIGNITYALTGSAPTPTGPSTGLKISNITRNTNDVTLSWGYTPNTSYNTQTQTTVNNGTSVSNTKMEITLVFTHSGTTYTISKSVPFNVIKASAVTQGADAELDKLMVDKLDLTVTLDNKLTCKVDAKVYHVRGSSITQVTDLTDYSASLILSNNDTVTLSKSTYFYRTSNISNSYSSMTNPPTSAVLKLYKSGTLMDEVPVAIKFDSGSIFTITDNAITSAVSQANGYTDSQISIVTQTANSISSRVTAIEGDYVTSSELSQTANNIQLNVYDELRNKTGIDISNGKITLNGNTDINGTLTLSDSNQGFVLQGTGGITQISPQSIGTYNNFREKSSTTVTKNVRDNEPGEEDGMANYTFRFSCNIPVGTIGSGKTITISPGSRSYYNSRGITVTGAESTKTYVIKEDGVQKASGSYSGDFTYTCAGGNVTVALNITTTISGTDLPEDPAYAIPSATISYNVNFIIPNDAYMLIGYDGMAINFGTSATAYMGAESTTFYYGNYGLQISNNGLKKWNGSNWIGLNDLNVKTFSTSYTLADSDDFLIFQGSSSCTLTLGNGVRTGRKIYVKDRGSGSLTLSGTIYKQNDRSSSNSVSLSDTMVFLIWDGSAWNLGYCG